MISVQIFITALSLQNTGPVWGRNELSSPLKVLLVSPIIK